MGIRARNIVLPAVILGVAAVIAAMVIKSKAPPTPVEVREKAWLVAAQTVTPGVQVPVLTLYGRVESLWSSQLTAGVAAEVQEVKVIEGDHVAHGQVLVELDDRDAKLLLAQRDAELREAQARIDFEVSRHAANLAFLPREKKLLELTRAEVSRLGDLVKKKVGAQSQLDTSRQAVERQAIAVREREQAVQQHTARMAELEAQRIKFEALRDQARLELERCRVKAPFIGRVSQVLVSPGRRVRVGDPLLEVFDTGNLVVRAQVPNRHLPAIGQARSAGQELRVRGQIDGVSVEARLLRVAGQVAAATGGVEALFKIERGGEGLQQGRFVRLNLNLPEQADLIAMPHEALYGGERVYLIDAANRMQSIEVVRVGETQGADKRKRILVQSPRLKPGDRVVTTQLPNAISGLLVRFPESPVD